jgi:hypothetical protein
MVLLPLSIRYKALTYTVVLEVNKGSVTGKEILRLIPTVTASALGNQFPYAKPEHKALLIDGLLTAGLPK